MLKSHLESMKIKSSGLVSKMRESKYMSTTPSTGTYDEYEASRMRYPEIPNDMTSASMLDYAANIAFNVRQGSKKTIGNTKYQNIERLKARYVQYGIQKISQMKI